MIPAWLLLDAGADAAEDLLSDVFGVARKQEKLDPLDELGFEAVVKNLFKSLLGAVGPGDRRALQGVQTMLDVNWPALSEADRERAIAAIAKGLGGIPTLQVQQVDKVLALQGPRIVDASKKAAASLYDLPITANFTVFDQKVVDFARASQAHYVRDQYGKRIGLASKKARDIVAKGLERGLDRYAISEELKPAMEAIGVNRSVGYFGMIASVFAARARTWGTLSAFDEAGIEYMEWVAMLDEATSDVCRFLDGETFPVAAARDRHLQVAASDDPEAVVEQQPWVRAGKAEDGSVALFYKQGGEKKLIALVERSGVGAKDDRGEYSRAASVDKLVAAGITSPPAHAHCRSLLVPASGSVARVQVPYKAPMTPPEERPATPARKPKKPTPTATPPAIVVRHLPPGSEPDPVNTPVVSPRMKDGQIPTFADEFVEATLSEAKRQALSKLYSEATRGVRGTAVDLSFALGEDASPVVDKSRPYLDSLVGSSLAAELKAKRADGKHKADAVRVGEHLREVDKLVWPKDTFDRDRVAGFIVGGAKGGTSPVLVRTGGKLYVHTGAEMLAAKLVGGQKDVVVDVIDLDAWRRWDRPIPDAKTRIFASKHGLAIDELVVEAPAARAVDAARAAAARQAMGRLPVAVQRKAADAGAKLYIVAKLTDRLPHLKGQAPRGWPPGSTWDDLSGAGGRDATYAVGGRFGGRGPANVALHEWGHALDRMGQNRRGGGERFSSQAWWRDMWKGATTAPAPGGADALERWSKDRGGGSRGDYFRQAPPAGPSELWAEIIADAFETDDGRARVERHFPGMLARMGEEILRQLDLVPPE